MVLLKSRIAPLPKPCGKCALVLFAVRPERGIVSRKGDAVVTG